MQYLWSYFFCKLPFGTLFDGVTDIVTLGKMGKKRIVIYSASQAEGALLEAMVSDIGAEVVEAESAEHLTSIVVTLRPSLVIIADIAPLINGCNIAQRLRQQLRSHHAEAGRTTIFVVAWQQSEQMVLSLIESGIDQLLTFPISIERLRHKAREELGSTTRR